MLGLDWDEGAEPFELTKRFVDRAPGAFPGFSLLTAFGQAAPLNLELQRAGRVLPFPFHFLDNNQAMNVRPKNYTWPEFYDHAHRSDPLCVLLARDSPPALPYQSRASARASSTACVRSRRAAQSGRQRSAVCSPRTFLSAASSKARVASCRSSMRTGYGRVLGPLWEALPEGAVMHDQNAYLKSRGEMPAKPRAALRRPQAAE